MKSRSSRAIPAEARRVAIYARVSTLDESPDLQLDELRELSRRRGWVVVREYVDHGIGGSKASRPALDVLVADARLRRFDIVVIWKLDRLARSVRHLIDLSEEFEALGIDFISATESMDTTTPHGRMVFHILAAVGEFERDLILERICAGMKAAKARGVKMGRPRLEPTEKEKQELLELRAQGLSIRKIAGIVSWFP